MPVVLPPTPYKTEDQLEIIDTLGQLFHLQQLCDVNFAVGPDQTPSISPHFLLPFVSVDTTLLVTVGAHRLVLASRSAVFKAMLFGQLKESLDQNTAYG